MMSQPNPKVVGATIIGFALVAGAYTLGNLDRSDEYIQTANVQTVDPVKRVSIEVTDKNNNGVEDWQDEFVSTDPIVLDKEASTYTPPDTLTGKMSIRFMEDYVRSRNYGVLGRSQDEIVEKTVNSLATETSQKLYGTSHITIMKEWDDQDIVNYANTAAATIYRNSVPNLESEVFIMQDYVNTRDEGKLEQLKTLVKVYQGYRDDTLKIPVPSVLAKEHLDLINTYEAIYEDINAMTQAFNDPVVSLLRLKRYQDDATGLAHAMRNMYLSLEPYADLFKAEDPAMLFVIFSPNYQI